MPVDSMLMGRTRGGLDRSARTAVVRRVRAALRALHRGRSSVTIVFTGDPEIRALNQRHRRIDRATDVLSFHLLDLAGERDPAGAGVRLGDIVISVDTARRRAAGRRLQGELARLAIHGLCHLFGHDHRRRGQADVMFALERRLLRASRPSRR